MKLFIRFYEAFDKNLTKSLIKIYEAFDRNLIKSFIRFYEVLDKNRGKSLLPNSAGGEPWMRSISYSVLIGLRGVLHRA